MPFPANKTKIVCTIGPASNSPAILEKMIRAGMNVARLPKNPGRIKSHQKTGGHHGRSARSQNAYRSI